jgi:hypothetical protein
MMAERGGRWPGERFNVELLLAPFGCLCVVLIYLLFPAAASGWRFDSDAEHCTCGARLSRRTVPHLQGPDPVERAPVLSMERGIERWVATLDGAEVDEPRDGPSTWSRLRDLLEVKRHNRTLTGSATPPGAPDVLLRADPAFPISLLQSCLETLRADNHRRVLLLVWHGGRYGGARVVLDGTARDGLRPSRFATYDDLAREVVRLRRAGRAVRLAVGEER